MCFLLICIPFLTACNETIYEAVSNIKFALSNLACVRISVKGNEDVIPNPETLDNALYNIERSIEAEIDAIYKALDAIDEPEKAGVA